MAKLKKEVLDVARAITWPVSARSASGSAKGQETRWELKPLPGNVEQRFVWQPWRARVWAPTVTAVEASEWTNSLTLSHVGGDRHELRVTGPGGKVVKDVELVNSRRLPLAVYAHDAASLATWREALPIVKAAYEPAFITLDVTEGRLDEPNPGPMFKGWDSRAKLEVDVKRLFRTGRLPEVSAPTLRVFLVDQLEVRSDQKVFKSRVTRADLARLAADGLEVAGVLPEDDPVLSASLTVDGKKLDIAAGVTRGGTSRLDFEFNPAFLDEHFPAGKTARFLVRYEAIASGFSGWSDVNLIVAAKHGPDGSELQGPALARIVIHEVGHALGQTATGLGDYDTSTFEPNDSHYERHQAVGHHCQTNGEPQGDPDPDGERRIGRRAGAGPLCIMYNDALADDVEEPAFCERCVLNLKLTYLAPDGALRKGWL